MHAFSHTNALQRQGKAIVVPACARLKHHDLLSSGPVRFVQWKRRSARSRCPCLRGKVWVPSSSFEERSGRLARSEATEQLTARRIHRVLPDGSEVSYKPTTSRQVPLLPPPRSAQRAREDSCRSAIHGRMCKLTVVKLSHNALVRGFRVAAEPKHR
jgi:hypothetical protein